jgi:ABC-type phosphate/phosphonate transport system substrate-binding protein
MSRVKKKKGRRWVSAAVITAAILFIEACSVSKYMRVETAVAGNYRSVLEVMKSNREWITFISSDPALLTTQGVKGTQLITENGQTGYKTVFIPRDEIRFVKVRYLSTRAFGGAFMGLTLGYWIIFLGKFSPLLLFLLILE